MYIVHGTCLNSRVLMELYVQYLLGLACSNPRVCKELHLNMQVMPLELKCNRDIALNLRYICMRNLFQALSDIRNKVL